MTSSDKIRFIYLIYSKHLKLTNIRIYASRFAHISEHREFAIGAANMSTPQYDPDEEETPDKVGIITGGASGKH